MILILCIEYIVEHVKLLYTRVLDFLSLFVFFLVRSGDFIVFWYAVPILF